MIPEDIKKKIAEYILIPRNITISVQGFSETPNESCKRHIEYGYSLAQEEINGLKERLEHSYNEYEVMRKDVERLKGLIEKAFDAHNIWTKGKTIYKENWQRFKQQNNL